MKLFIILFVLAILFVVGSASMMRFFDSRRLTTRDQDKQADQKIDQSESHQTKSGDDRTDQD